MSLPAETRHRWGLDQGGDIGYIDLGDTVLIVPGGLHRLRSQLLELLGESEWSDARSGFGDAELATE